MTRRQSHSVWLPLLTMLTILAMLTSCIRPVEPVVEMPLDVVTEEVTFQNDEITLAGTLTLPDAVGPHPALMLISGSGQQDRDETIPFVPGYKPFQLIAEYLTQQGIAVLRYDDRGVGGSTGDPSRATTADFAQDAEAGLTYLFSRPDINPKQIGLLGHSEGAIIAAMIAARNPDVAFVIAMAGPAVSGYDILIVQTERILRTADLSEEAVTAAMAQQRQVLDLTVAEKWDELKALLLNVGHQQIDALPAAQKEALGDVDAYLNQQIELSMRSMQGWMRYFLMYNPAEDWAQIKAPVLALFGGLDTQVDQAQNRPAFEAALQKAGNADVTIKVFEEANHLFQQAKTGSPEEYATLPAEFVPNFLETIGVWLLARTTGQDLRSVESQSSTHDYIAVLLAPDLPDGKAVSMTALDATKTMLKSAWLDLASLRALYYCKRTNAFLLSCQSYEMSIVSFNF
ncbi:MAG: alpha/beta fold hydrolase [Caldilineaceae bacterium]